MAGEAVHISRSKDGPEAKCDLHCGFWAIYNRAPEFTLISKFTPAEVRDAARRHVRETGHTVTVTVVDETRYEFGEHARHEHAIRPASPLHHPAGVVRIIPEEGKEADHA